MLKVSPRPTSRADTTPLFVSLGTHISLLSYFRPILPSSRPFIGILMFPLYTVGLLGRHPAAEDTVDYFKLALMHYCGSMSAFRLLVAVSAPDDLRFCHALLELKKSVPGLQLAMVVVEPCWQDHDTAVLYGQMKKKLMQ